MLIRSETLVRSVPSDELPAELAEVDCAQLVYFRGSCLWTRPRIGIVGTRAADPEALRFAYALGSAAARAGCTVVSGGAIGIDAAAHQGALDTGGETIAVLATGVREAYPPSHAELFARIAKQGALLSEHNDGLGYPSRFLDRNRLIAALSRTIVVVQAPARSGALSTARVAKKLGRELYAVSASPWDLRGRGNLQLIDAGAQALTRPTALFESGSQSVLCPQGTLSLARPETPEPSPKLGAELNGEAAQVLQVLGSRPMHIDELSKLTSLSAARLQGLLLELLIAGFVEERTGSRYVVAP
ncbi:MAG: DNA processing protein [Polyangiales bacterium]|jgi:DNA processing protein